MSVRVLVIALLIQLVLGLAFVLLAINGFSWLFGGAAHTAARQTHTATAGSGR
ncbi:MAG TPA: hypothetical protein VNR66_06735 [Solirubrobacteraceae bacterium]|nr:hypothetical protein [Solirubrobacteraceae bacterium]